VQRRVKLDRVSLHVQQCGEGAPLLLVHGFPFDHRSWQPQLDGLSGICHLIAPDLRGFGASDVVEGVATMQQLADDLASLLDVLQLDQPVTVCGLSMGGYIAFQFWAQHAERLDRLILCDTRAAADAPLAAAARRSNAERVLAEGVHDFARDMIPKLFAESTVRQQPALVDAVRVTMQSASPQGVAAALLGMAERPDMTPRLHEIDIPTLLVGGTDDAITPCDEMRSIAATMPQASFVEIPAAGHLAPLENPQAVNDAIRDFLHSATRSKSTP